GFERGRFEEGQRRIERAHLAPYERQHGGCVPGPDEDAQLMRSALLRQRQFKLRAVIAFEAEGFDVARDADDLRPGLAGAEADAPAERVLAGEKLLRESFIDDHDARLSLPILLAEAAPLPQGDAHQFVVAGADMIGI